MKRVIALGAAASALILASCTAGPLPQEEGTEITITAMMAENNTKTIIQDGTTSVLWEAGDEIKIFYDGTGSRFTNQYTSPSGTAKFSGMLNVVFGSNEGFSDTTPIWGLYPYRADATSDNASVTTTLPSAQTGRAGSFAKGTFITLGKSAGLNMGFYNVCGGVRFSLTQEGVKEVVFQGQNDEDIAGKVKLAFVDGVPAVQEIIEGQKSITLTAPGGGTFQTGQWYYIVALPGALSNGFKMTFNTDTQFATLKSSGAKTIKRGIFGSLADADEDLIYKDKEGGDEPPTGNIAFADLAAKYACVAKFDTNGDGEVSIEEAEAATSFEDLFTNWKGVTSFDEIKFFKNVHSLDAVFNGCNNFVSIIIPDNITDLGEYAFYNCSSLNSVKLPAGITTIGNCTFKGCVNLTSIIIPSGVISIGSYAFGDCSSLSSIELSSGVITIENSAFQSCTSLTNVSIPSSVTSIGSYAFKGCSSLSTIELPTNLNTIGQYAFSGCALLVSINIPSGVSLDKGVFSDCSSLKYVTLPSDMTSLPDYCFQNCTALTTITWPENLQSIGSWAFYGCRFKENGCSLELPSTVTTIGDYAFEKLHHLIIPSNSVVSISENSFVKNYTYLYVPAGNVEMYRVRTNWIDYADRIMPISEYRFNFFGGTVGEAIDLGLSVKWASWNVGASSSEEYGAYFSWGETEPSFENNYIWDDYLLCNGSSNKLIKYNNNSSYGTVDNKIILEPGDDAACVNWGGAWRMPTLAEQQELLSNCTIAFIQINGVNGCLLTSNIDGYTDSSIFLPAAGNRGNKMYNWQGRRGFYSSSSLNTDGPHSRHEIMINLEDRTVKEGSGPRYYGFTIRPVCE